MNDTNVERRTPQTQTPEQQLQTMLDAFDKANAKGDVHPGQDLKAVLDSTPGLKTNVLDAIGKNQLQKIEALNVDGALGVYMGDSRTIQISPDQLHIARTDPEMLNSVRFTLGHEVKHAADRAQIMTSDANLEKGINAVAQSDGKVHDYTAAIKQFNETSRSLETHAELTGYNVVVDQVLKDNPKATLRDVYNTSPSDMDPYIEKGGTPGNPAYTPRAGITLDGLKMPETKENLAAVNTYFYEARGYPQQNVSNLLDYAGQVEAQLHPGKDAPKIQVDLGAIGVKASDVSTSTPYVDASTMHKRAAPVNDGTSPELSGNPLYDGAAEGLGRTRAGAALEGQAFQQAAAAMAVQAQQDGLSRIDSVHEGQDGRLFSIQGQPGAPDALRSHVDREQAVRQPLEQSAQTLQAPAPQVQAREQDVQQHAPLMR
ncbi:XVIPCD domain-containing protein [Pseudoxanthomonas sp.]|uniref:XVIPCD domain-containing protein n=1 Tax=Pseudoxanthomonas sp. TaxID=1871049 RepID=UPI002616E355|nr:XVIPCD domain-containing protein [Pseudoxanthomonas sp.]WDS35313.1 MAG: hypothetical protein O8I58_13250 [Pseudoxanthomonas sp.]